MTVNSGQAETTTKFGFTGHREDSESSLTYAHGRYLNTETRTFISQDAAFWSQSYLSVQIPDPQNFNTYAYVKNNPVNAVDPDGRLTIYIYGTWGQDSLNDPETQAFINAIGNTTKESVVPLMWSGGNNFEARTNGAIELAALIDGHEFAKGEKLTIVTHSHGGNVALEASWLIDRKIDNLYTMGLPTRGDYTPNMENIGQWNNVYSNNDYVQSHAGYNISGKGFTGYKCGNYGCVTVVFNTRAECSEKAIGCTPINEVGTNVKRKNSNANNINVTYDANSGMVKAHESMHQGSYMWDLATGKAQPKQPPKPPQPKPGPMPKKTR